MPLNNTRGISLIELMLSVSLVSAVLIVLSLGFSRASASNIQNRQRAVATRIADSQIQSLKSQPYPYLNTTDTTYAAASWIGNFTSINCDCRTFGFSVIPSTASQVESTTYNVASCVHFVSSGTWNSQCSSVGDTGYKNLLVQVTWSNGAQTTVVSQESMMTR